LTYINPLTVTAIATAIAHLDRKEIDEAPFPSWFPAELDEAALDDPDWLGPP